MHWPQRGLPGLTGKPGNDKEIKRMRHCRSRLRGMALATTDDGGLARDHAYGAGGRPLQFGERDPTPILPPGRTV